jgi:hypothetical protein
MSSRASPLTVSAAELRPNSRGQFDAICGKCLHSSVFITAPTADAAWAELLALGWSTNAEGRPYCVCPNCTANPRTVQEIARGVQRLKKKK